MNTQTADRPANSANFCKACREDMPLDFEFSMAFQPIVDVETGKVLAHEALVRGLAGEGALSILSQVNDGNRYTFDQAARTCAIEWAQQLGMDTLLSINFMPNAVYNPIACIQSTLKAARRVGWDTRNIMFEVSEAERVMDRAHLLHIFRSYREMGFKTAIDDFGAGYAGLTLLNDFQPDYIKLDMELIRDIDMRRVSRSIVSSMVRLCNELGCRIIAEGIETADEAMALRDLGITYLQGFYFARPGFQALPEITAPALVSDRRILKVM